MVFVEPNQEGQPSSLPSIKRDPFRLGEVKMDKDGFVTVSQCNSRRPCYLVEPSKHLRAKMAPCWVFEREGVLASVLICCQCDAS